VQWPPELERLSSLPYFEQAACRGVDPALFFPERGDPTGPAKAVCAGCVHKLECLALGLGEHFGIWGGTSERERRSLRQREGVGVIDELEVSTNGNHVETGPAVRLCPVCKGPVPDGRKVTCSSVCAQRNDHRGKRKPALARAEIPVGIVPLATSPSSGLSAAVSALVGSLDELAGMQKVTIELAGQVVTITRAG
jgi:WhiB family redox-sensing transcriptional regulator